MPINTGSTAGFRYDINTLRGIAIFGVLLFHYKLNFFSGGFAGVDVFFVISGYLMSKIVINSIDNNDFVYWRYLEKRVKRILPALLFLILALSIVCFFIYLPEDYKVNQRNATGSILFLSNILYWQSADSYFAPSSDTNIFLHTWSLSIEWQFYLLYPIILLILSKICKNKLVYLTAFTLLTLSIAVASIITTNYKANASFYLLPTRSWEMLFGGLAFLSEGFINHNRYKKIISFIGYTLILFSFIFLKESLFWPGGYTLLPVTGTFLVIIANYNNSKFIKSSSVQFIGKISYSVYLWHWPVYVIAQYFGIERNFETIALLILASLLVGYASFIHIENIKFINIKPMISLTIILLFTTAISGHLNVNNAVFKQKTLEIADYEKSHKDIIDKQLSRGTCFINEPDKESFNKKNCLCFDDNRKNILLIGDSHAAQLSESLKTMLYDKNIHLLQATVGATFPTINPHNSSKPQLQKILEYVYQDFIPKNANKIDGVIISAYFDTYSDYGKDAVLNGMKEAIAYLEKYGIKAIIIGQNESYTIPYPTIAAKNMEYNINITRKYLNKHDYEMNDFLSNNLRPYYINIINTNTLPDLSSINEPYMFDTNHASRYGANLIVNKVLSDSIATRFLHSIAEKQH
ncbi:acyltransferase family protein [Hymenobacter sp. UV11]|uniref:acyltransferase family protein n=1 Tax=Hymenobacter sp. UV11 TaxID=1849735 RepID=UPI0014151B98|nr:acyltransferase family protein [Hymenobacter sp. UV11]